MLDGRNRGSALGHPRAELPVATVEEHPHAEARQQRVVEVGLRHDAVGLVGRDAALDQVVHRDAVVALAFLDHEAVGVRDLLLDLLDVGLQLVELRVAVEDVLQQLLAVAPLLLDALGEGLALLGREVAAEVGRCLAADLAVLVQRDGELGRGGRLALLRRVDVGGELLEALLLGRGHGGGRGRGFGRLGRCLLEPLAAGAAGQGEDTGDGRQQAAGVSAGN